MIRENCELSIIITDFGELIVFFEGVYQDCASVLMMGKQVVLSGINCIKID